MDRAPLLLYVINDTAFFLSHRLPLAAAARKEGWDVHVATPQKNAPEVLGRFGFEHHLIPLTRRGMNPIQEAGTIQALLRLYRQLQPDLVHHLTIKPVLYGGTAARRAKVPAVVHAVTGLGYVFVAPGPTTALLRTGIRRWYKLALSHPNQRVIFQNPDNLRMFVDQGLLAEDQAVLIRGSGVDVEAFHPLPEAPGPPCIVLATRMLKDKGVAEFVEAARQLRAAGCAASFVLVGNTDPGNPSAIPRETLEAWDREGAVRWWGFRSDMLDVFGKAHVVCLPSYGEGVPKVLLEAAACGRPLVASDSPGCREIVRQGETGLLVPPRDATALAAALRRLAEDPALRGRMGRAGRKLVEAEFSQDHVVARTLAVYRELHTRAGTARGGPQPAPNTLR